MSTLEVLALVAVVVLVLVIGALLVQQRRRQRLRQQFGPEYDRTVKSSDRRRDAERELSDRAQRRQELHIVPLPDRERRDFSDRWTQTQEAFVDRPSLAVRQADVLVAEVMGRRGYPVGDFETQARDVSVDHAHVVDQYRAAHDISLRNERGEATTEELRQAMVHYRALFADLLSDRDDERDDRADAYRDREGAYRDEPVEPYADERPLPADELHRHRRS